VVNKRQVKERKVESVIVESYRGYNIVAFVACGEVQGYYGDGTTKATKYYTPAAVTIQEIKEKIDHSWEVRKESGHQVSETKEAEEVEKVKTEKKKISKPKYDFVQQYTLIDPKKVKKGYDNWKKRCFVLVAYEQNKYLIKRVKMDTNIVFPFLKALRNAPSEISKRPENRTVSVINMKHGAKAYVFPNLHETNKQYDIVFTNAENGHQNLPLSCFTSPEINLAIVAQAKIYR